MIRLILLASVSLVSVAATATAAVFTSSTAFFAATPGDTIENYSTATSGQLLPNGSTLDALTYGFSTTGGMGGVITNKFNAFSGLSLAAKQVAGPLSGSDFFYGGDSFTVTFASPVTAVGIFANVNLNSGTYTVSSTVGSATTGSTAYDTPTFVFVGLTSDTPFSSATFVGNSASTGVYNIPEIAYQTAIPEPATLALLGLGLAGAGLVRRRR